MGRLFRIWLAAALMLAGSAAGAASAVEPLQLFNRDIVELRAVLGGLTPAERVARAQQRFADLSAEDLRLPPQLRPLTPADQRGLTVVVGDRPLFTLLEADLDPEERLPLTPAAERALRGVQAAIDARRAQAEPTQWLRGGAVALAVLAGWLLVGWLAGQAHRRLEPRASSDAEEDGLAATTYLRVFARRVGVAAVWLLAAGLSLAGVVLLLEAFPWTAPWGDRLLAAVRHLGGWLVGGTMAALPGLLTVLVIVLVARAVQDAVSLFMQHVQSGRLRVPFLHPETVGATRRLLNVGVWGLALAVAYPFLPGSGSDAFKGLSVLFGLMITLGSTGVVTQLMSGLVVVYSRSLKKGDFVAVDGIEGVVSEVGALAVKITTMRNEEITVPNAVITGTPIRNYSKLGGQQGTLVSTKVTIGYDAPWRKVHALLVDAALATPGLRQQPAPFVCQRALSDFYVEYELFAHIDRPLERVPILSALHAAIQDEFNRHGVQIMSPHFYEQPAQAVIVPPSRWHMPPARSPEG
jgi:small-conductance mechanosensitive channel